MSSIQRLSNLSILSMQESLDLVIFHLIDKEDDADCCLMSRWFFQIAATVDLGILNGFAIREVLSPHSFSLITSILTSRVIQFLAFKLFGAVFTGVFFSFVEGDGVHVWAGFSLPEGDEVTSWRDDSQGSSLVKELTSLEGFHFLKKMVNLQTCSFS